MRTDTAVARAARCRQPRPDPRPGRPREQPQGRQRRAPEAPADRVHRRVRLGQELAGVRHDRRGVAAADQRDLQRLRAGLHADAGAARGRRARRADDRDHRRPGADGRRPRSTVGTATDANAMLRILFSRLGKPHIGSPNAFSFNVPSVRASGGITVERGGKTQSKKATFNRLGGMCPRCEGRGSVTDFDLTALYDDTKSLARCAHDPRLQHGRLVRPHLRGCGYFDMDKPMSKFNKKELHEPALPGADQDQGRGHQPHPRGHDPEDPGLDARQGPRGDAAAHPRVVSGRTSTTSPESDRTRLAEHARKSKVRRIDIADACAIQISGLAESVRDLDEPSVAPLLEALGESLDTFVEIGSVPLARPGVGTLSAASRSAPSDPPPRLRAHRHHVRLRRADHRPPPA